MAEVTYLCNHQRLSSEVENPHFLLTAKDSYLLLGSPNNSNYCGFFVKQQGQRYKILSNISIGGVERIDLSQTALRQSKKEKQEFCLLDEGILMEGKGDFTLTLDCKQLYDESDKGRIYKVEVQQAMDPFASTEKLAKVSLLLVEYTKYVDDSLSQRQYTLHVGIATTLSATLLQQWRQVHYPYDERRGSSSTPWVFDLATLAGDGSVAVCYGNTKLEAQQKALKLIFTKINHVVRNKEQPTLSTHAQLAWQSLESLQTPAGIMAGLPWFFHEWSRDELTCCGGLLEAKRYTKVIQILDKWYGLVREDGSLPAIYPDEGLPSTDAPGWLGKRTLDLLQRLSAEGTLHELEQERIIRWRDQTGQLIDRCATRIRNDLLWTEANTTWMDTSFNDDGRAGCRIEIQALFLALCDCHAYLCTITRTPIAHHRQELSKRMVNAVHQRLVSNGCLLDGLHADGSADLSVRPNIFLAYYVAPKLFSKDEWKRFFEAALPQLWLSWGGLASISTSHPNFHSRGTGERNDSYHRGDSWYFVNNIAALAMYRVDAAAFRAPIQKILQASVADLLSQGICGHCSELSSAAAQEPMGCHSQAWSAATLIELAQAVRD
jgi:hypothetical protein